jgi:hypothetical protein
VHCRGWDREAARPVALARALTSLSSKEFRVVLVEQELLHKRVDSDRIF